MSTSASDCLLLLLPEPAEATYVNDGNRGIFDKRSSVDGNLRIDDTKICHLLVKKQRETIVKNRTEW